MMAVGNRVVPILGVTRTHGPPDTPKKEKNSEL